MNITSEPSSDSIVPQYDWYFWSWCSFENLNMNDKYFGPNPYL